MATVAERIIEAAMEYAAMGLHVIPLKTRNKMPLLTAWQRAASISEETIIGWWDTWPEANVGIQLGRRSNIVDIEGDTPKSEKEIVQLFGGEIPICPTYQAQRGKHRLFRWRSDLPGGAVLHIGEIEIRTGNGEKGTQSVFPPSIHPSGRQYTWIPGLSLAEIEPPLIPDNVLAQLWNLSGEASIGVDPKARSSEHWEKVLAGLPEGERNEGLASTTGKLLRGTGDLHDSQQVRCLYQAIMALNERNRPPLPEKEVRATFTGLLKKEQNRRMTEETRAVLLEPIDQQVSGGSDTTGDMRLVIVKSDPPAYELYAPQFNKADRGCIVLTAEQMCSGAAIRVQALRQASYPLTTQFGKAWNARTKNDSGGWLPTLYERLVNNSEERQAPLEDKRHLVVAQLLNDAIASPRILEDGQTMAAAGSVTKLTNGDIVFKFAQVWSDMRFGPDAVLRPELSKILEKIGAGRHGPQKFIKLSSASIRALAELLEDGVGQI